MKENKPVVNAKSVRKQFNKANKSSSSGKNEVEVKKQSVDKPQKVTEKVSMDVVKAVAPQLSQADRVYLVTTNQQIAEHAKKKELSAAKQLYQELQAKGIANNHTYCSIVNAAVRCGDREYIDTVLSDMTKANKKVVDDVVLCTTLIKSYCAEGNLDALNLLLYEMVYKSKKMNKPNIRTINTILRGCVQYGLAHDAEHCLLILKNPLLAIEPDASSYDYVLSLQAQNLDVNSAYPKLGRLIKGDDKKAGDESTKTGSILDDFTVTSLYIKLAKASILRGDWKLANKHVTQATSCLDRLQNASETSNEADEVEVSDEEDDEDENNTTKKDNGTKKDASNKQVLGGKRAWKSTENNLSVDTSRNQSLMLYREHIKAEFGSESKYLTNVIKSNNMHNSNTFLMNHVLPYYSRLMVFGYNDNYNALNMDIARRLACALFHNFGLGVLLQERCSKDLYNVYAKSNPEYFFPYVETITLFLKKNKYQEERKKMKQRKNLLKKDDEKTEEEVAKEEELLQRQVQALQEKLSSPEAQSIAKAVHDLLVHRFPGYFLKADSKLVLERVFADIRSPCTATSSSDNIEEIKEHPKPKQQQKKYKLEICSGAGEWAINQAKADPENNWMTLEVKVDRVHQTFHKMIFEQVNNLLAMAGDAMTVLPRHFLPQSIDNVFVNHPEPPQQQGGEESEARHLLNEEFFGEVQRVLKYNGLCTIVTDNLWYGKLLTRLISRIITGRCANLHNVTNSGWQVEYSFDNINLYVGEPGADAGHVVAASSYFDRLWTRSDVKARYFLVLSKSPVRNRAKLQIPSQPVTTSAGTGKTANTFAKPAAGVSTIGVKRTNHITFNNNENDNDVGAKPVTSSSHKSGNNKAVKAEEDDDDNNDDNQDQDEDDEEDNVQAEDNDQISDKISRDIANKLKELTKETQSTSAKDGAAKKKIKLPGGRANSHGKHVHKFNKPNNGKNADKKRRF